MKETSVEAEDQPQKTAQIKGQNQDALETDVADAAFLATYQSEQHDTGQHQGQADDEARLAGYRVVDRTLAVSNIRKRDKQNVEGIASDNAVLARVRPKT